MMHQIFISSTAIKRLFLSAGLEPPGSLIGASYLSRARSAYGKPEHINRALDHSGTNQVGRVSKRELSYIPSLIISGYAWSLRCCYTKGLAVIATPGECAPITA